jgi:hypothetical protein
VWSSWSRYRTYQSLPCAHAEVPLFSFLPSSMCPFQFEVSASSTSSPSRGPLSRKGPRGHLPLEAWKRQQSFLRVVSWVGGALVYIMLLARVLCLLYLRRHALHVSVTLGWRFLRQPPWPLVMLAHAWEAMAFAVLTGGIHSIHAIHAWPASWVPSHSLYGRRMYEQQRPLLVIRATESLTAMFGTPT